MRISRINSGFPNGITMLNTDIGWAVGDDGRIYKFNSNNLNNITHKIDYFQRNFELYQNIPNPFNPETTIEYFLTEGGYINISLFNILGQKLETLFAGRMDSGKHQFKFINQNLSFGVYFYSLSQSGITKVKKFLIIK